MRNCNVCSKDANKQFTETKECSHIDCPYRRKAWSDGLRHARYEPVKREPETTPEVDKDFK